MGLFNIGDDIDDRYTITSRLGQGGMAYVYRARDKHLERDIALKLLRPHLTDTDQERFRREIKALAKLNHPSIVTIYDLGLGDHVYFTMELVTGGVITDLGPLGPDLENNKRLLSAAASVAEALAYVHRQGMVHRDLTPRNILLTPSSHAKVTDFGLVQLAESTRQITRTGFTLGTPQYMAPEQATGEWTGAHTDLYALGAVLYRAVTGQLPFDAENDQAVLYQHVYGGVTEPVEHNPYVSVSLSQLLMALLAKDPNKRPSSGFAVADALRSIMHELDMASSASRLGGGGQCGVLPWGPAHPPSLMPQWVRKLEYGPQWPAAITSAQNFILIGTKDEFVYVLHPADGSLQARYLADDEVNSPIYYQQTSEGGQLLYHSRSGTLSAISWPDGKPLWQDDRVFVTGLLPDGEDVLVSTREGQLESRSNTGSIHWCYEINEPIITPPTVHAGQVCVIGKSGWLHAVNRATGKGLYRLQLSTVAAQPSARGGILMLPERSGELHAFQMANKEVLWSYDTEGQIWATPLLWQQFVFVVSWSGVLRCLAQRTGDDIWQMKLSSKVTASPVIAGGTIYVGTEDGDLHAFDARSGKRLYEDRISSSPIQATPLALGGTLIVAALDGTIKAYR